MFQGKICIPVYMKIDLNMITTMELRSELDAVCKF